MARDDLHFRLRIPEELKRKIETASEEKGRSMTAEIVERLEQSFQDPLLLPASMLETIERRSREQRVPVRVLILKAIDEAFPVGYRLGEFFESWAVRAAKTSSMSDRKRIIEMANEHPDSTAAGFMIEEGLSALGAPTISIYQTNYTGFRRLLGTANVLDPIRED